MFDRDGLLIAICEVIQLSRPKYAMVSERYKAIGRWLGAQGSVFENDRPEIYPQGSFAIQTTVRPHGEIQEYDLDFVMELAGGATRYQISPEALLNDLESRLRENGKYKGIVERMNRCIRLNYAGDFHLDILPALPAPNRGLSYKIIVPDRELHQYKPSNPKGYRDWFRAQSTRVLLKESSIEPLTPMQAAAEKPNLCNIVQLAKRARDVEFSKPETAVRSIVLTTLLAMHYSSGSSLEHELSMTLKATNTTIAQCRNIIEVYNPANPEEKLSECWDKYPEQYQSFTSWMSNFCEKVDQLQRLHGLELAIALKAMFGEGVVNQAVQLNASKVEKLRSSGQLGMSSRGSRTGSLSIASAVAPAIKKNTFYGQG